MTQKGHRYRSKLYVIDDIYDKYISTIDNDKYDIGRGLFTKVLSDYFMYISVQIIYKAREFKLPANMGTVFVRKRKPKMSNKKFLVVDRLESKKLKKRVFYTNEHSDGYSYSFRWSKANAYVKNKTMYELVMTRSNKRELASVIKNRIIDYVYTI